MNEILDKSGLLNPAQEKTGKTDDTTGIFVSLYLIVLAFFVVLNSISNQEQNKVNAATESVTRAFKNPFEPEADFVDVAANEKAPTPNDEFYDQIQGIFASLVGFDGKFPTGGGSIVKVNFRASDLFELESSAFRDRQQAFLQQLTNFLAAGRVSDKREIDFLISTGKALPAGPRYWEDLNILRAGAFVAKLKELGVAENQLSVGVVPGQEDLITLTFRSRERKSSQQKLTGHSAVRQTLAPQQAIPDRPASPESQDALPAPDGDKL